MPKYAYSENRQAEIFNHAIEKMLNQILGQDATEILYEYLESNYFVHRYEVAEKFEAFNRALEQYLGTGAAVLERLIVQNLELIEQNANENVDLSGHQKIIKLA